MRNHIEFELEPSSQGIKCVPRLIKVLSTNANRFKLSLKTRSMIMIYVIEQHILLQVNVLTIIINVIYHKAEWFKII